MSWREFDAASPAASPDNTGSVPWHILAAESFAIPGRRELAVHGEFRLEGELILDGSARLRVKL